MYCNEVYDGYLKSYDIMLLLTVIQDYVLCDKRGTVKDYGLDVNEVYNKNPTSYSTISCCFSLL